MSGYRPDWVGAMTCGVAIGLAVVIATRMWPRRDDRKEVIFIASGVGAALAVIARTVMRRFGI